MKKAVMIVLLIVMPFLLIQSVSADKIHTDVGKISLTAGCSTSYNITIVHEGKPIECYCEYKVSPDSDGIDVYILPPLTLNEGENVIKVFVYSSMLLAPGSYVITIDFFKEQSVGGKSEVRRSSNRPAINPESYWAPEDPPDLFSPYEPGEPQHWAYVSPAQGGFPWVWFLPIVTGILFTLLVLYRNERRNQK